MSKQDVCLYIMRSKPQLWRTHIPKIYKKWEKEKSNTESFFNNPLGTCIEVKPTGYFSTHQKLEHKSWQQWYQNS